MFGYILVNPKTLSKDEKARYRAVYCGLCRQLKKYGAPGRATLSYDMTFVALLLQSVYEINEQRGTERCAMRPLPPHSYIASEATEYAADMNILFAYYNELDDWRDEHDQKAYRRSKVLGAYLEGIAEKWPVQAACAAKCVERLNEMERQNVLNPDEPANCFGEVMGTILDWRGESENGSGSCIEPNIIGGESKNGSRGAGLRRMGEALGRFIYLLDACDDLHGDIKKERYNPLIAQIDMDFEPLLTMLIGECTGEFEKLAPKRDVHLLRNVLYSGVWMKYRKKRRGGVAGGDMPEKGDDAGDGDMPEESNAAGGAMPEEGGAAGSGGREGGRHE